MKVLVTSLLILSLSALCARLAGQTARNTEAGALAPRINAIIDTGELGRAHWGITIRDLATGASLYERNANALFAPASTLKLVVSAVALHHLGADFRFHTTLYGTGAVSNGVLDGDLIVRGRGDPTISGRYDKTRTSIFEAWADSLREHGITRITGQVIADQTYFDDKHVRGDWEVYDLNWWYAAPVAALGFNDNAVDFRVLPGAPGAAARITWEPQTGDMVFANRTRTVRAGERYTLDFDRVPGTDTVFAYGEIPLDAAVRTESFATRDPGRYLGTVLREVLERRGISVGVDAIRVIDQPLESPSRNATQIFDFASPPLPQVIGPILQNSQNWFAEQLLKAAAREVSGEGSWEAGLALERRFLIDELHVDSTAIHLRDASGLSSQNLITPRMLSDVTRYIAQRPEMKPVHDALPVSAAATGSLRRRFEDMPGRVRAKTGTIGNVDALSGLVTTDSGRTLVFAILVNKTGLPSAKVRDAIDRIVRLAAKS